MAGKTLQRNGTIDFLKFLFTIMIMLYHTTKVFKGGYIAVDFFFIVSGFLMAKSMLRRLNNGLPLGTDTISFVMHKAKGIFPYYLVAWIMSFVITWCLAKSGSDYSLITLLRSIYNITMTEMSGNYDMGHRLQASWYVSAMLLSMLVIYPVRKRYTDVFDKIIAVIIFLVFVGMAYQSDKGVSTFTVGYKTDLYMYNGMVRGIAEISLGCIAYNISSWLSKYSFTTFGGILLSIVEWFGFVLVFYFAFTTSASDIDIALLPLIAISVAVAFSGKSIFDRLFAHSFFTFLGSFSLQMYFTHELVKNVIIPYLRKNTDIALFQNKELGVYLTYYFALTLIAAIVCRVLGRLFEKLISYASRKLKSLVLKDI